MAQVLLKNHAENNHNLDKTRINQISQKLISFQDSVVNEDIQFAQKSTEKLRQSLKNLEEIKRKTKQYRQACTTSVNNLKLQEDKYNSKLKEFQATFHLSSHEETYKQKVSEGQKRHIYNCQARVAKAAELNYKRLKKLDIPEKKSSANELFKWILVAFYFQTEAKFYFPNFIEQVLDNDDGVDLKERLGKINAYDSKQQQRLKTELIVKDEQNLRKCEQFQGFEPQINILFEIAKLFLDSCNIGRDLKKSKKQVLQFRKKMSAKSQENNEILRDRNSIGQRIAVGEAYLKQLHAMQSLYDQKHSAFSLEISKGEQFYHQLSSRSGKKVGGLQFNAEGQQKQRGHCQCTIY